MASSHDGVSPLLVAWTSHLVGPDLNCKWRQTRKSHSSSLLGSRQLAWIRKLRSDLFFFLSSLARFSLRSSAFSQVHLFAYPQQLNLWLQKLKQFNTENEVSEMFLAILIFTDREQVNQFTSWSPALKNINCGKQMNLYRLQIW